MLAEKLERKSFNWTRDASLPSRGSMESFLASPFATIGIHAIDRNWRALRKGTALPFYEDVVLGRASRVGSNIALVRLRRADWTIMFAGEEFEAWIGGKAQGQIISSLKLDCRLTLQGAMREALETACPVHAVAHSVHLGYVHIYDLVVYPLANRWGEPILLVYVGHRKETYSLIDAIFASSLDGLLALAPVKSADGAVVDFQVVSLNDSAARIVAREAEQIRWQLISELFPLLATEGALDRLVAMHSAGTTDHFEVDYLRADGETAHFSVHAAAMEDLIAISLVDITAIKRREASFRLLFQDNPLPMMVYDAATLDLLDINKATVEHYGYSREAMLALSMLDIRPREDRASARVAMLDPHAMPNSGDIWRHLRADGSTIDVQVYSRAVDFHGKPARIAAYVDVTERRKIEARISHMAHHDALTGLPNRTLLLEHLRKTLSQCERRDSTAAIHYIDLDFFKDVNDTLGHPVGDRLLGQVADRLREAVRDNDVVSRLGGDEFCVLQPDLGDVGEANALAERIIKVVSAPYEIEGHQVIIGASVGIAIAPADGETADALLKNVDMAMYRAKEDGRGVARFFQADMDAKVQARRELEMDLRAALVRGEFELHYQPVVAVESGEVSAFEALLRWRHPTRGMVPPDRFIPVAEQVGLIVPIGEWVLRTACREAANWPATIRVAVNLSAVQFKGGKLAAIVASALAEAGLAPRRLELEITESVLLRDSDSNLNHLNQLRALGTRISMDDFGTGYSSLSYLRSFPFDKIKIDRSFVKDVAGSQGDGAIVRAVAGLGTSLGMITTAEGVETREQLARVVADGCTEIQGYLFGRPVPAGEVQDTLERIRLMDKGQN
ncbi:PAS domain S-box-containing protein/diguanylate cyclase (GGDEF) domain-containing protein [Devosia crocina]|uniref:PAS domain S-box-containing protein/diguanylate cyclase (GGDEF) domain-containing protein n=1 Tax=Devosia crocina TaxID=429728 RepID=A0A1I7NTQ5_9HYPH|nr:EAL domain-containing protein [Devosia crocina]SFV38034.1 PAS domain S-box-containing protein/diguanylate cyclase (GGDEF) domain-containing protein [Devosia crocina]